MKKFLIIIISSLLSFFTFAHDNNATDKDQIKDIIKQIEYGWDKRQIEEREIEIAKVGESLGIKADHIYNLELPDSNDVIQKFVDNQSRDEDDKDRYSSLYGFDYGDLSGYDIVVNTTNKEADSVFKEVVSELENFGFRTN